MMIVFLHGFLGNKSDWDEVISHLPFPCTTFDLPGHGTSPADFDLFTAMAKLPPFHLVGYSLGGRIAREYLGNTLSLTLISTHPGLTTEQEKWERKKQDELLAQEIRSLPIDEFIRRWYDQPLFKTLKDKIDICKKRTQQDKEGLAKALQKFSLGELSANKREAHYILGEHDEKYRTLYKSIPHALIPNAGHAIHLENPIQLAKEIYEHVLSI